MAEEIQEAVQIIRVGYDGIEIAMKLGGASIEQIKKFAGFLFAVMDHEKAMGKTDMRKLLVKGGDLQVLKFAAGEQRQVEKLAKNMGFYIPCCRISINMMGCAKLYSIQRQYQG